MDSSRVYAPSSARSAITLMMRGTPPDSRCSSRCAPGVKRSRVAPATRSAVADVGDRLRAPQRLEVIAAGDALGELAQLRLREHLAQFRLADQDDLQQLLRRGLEIGQQPHLLQHVGGEVLGFVHHQHDAPAAAVRVEQEMREDVDQRLDAALGAGRHLHVQLVADGTAGTPRA